MQSKNRGRNMIKDAIACQAMAGKNPCRRVATEDTGKLALCRQHYSQWLDKVVPIRPVPIRPVPTKAAANKTEQDIDRLVDKALSVLDKP